MQALRLQAANILQSSITIEHERCSLCGYKLRTEMRKKKTFQNKISRTGSAFPATLHLRQASAKMSFRWKNIIDITADWYVQWAMVKDVKNETHVNLSIDQMSKKYGTFVHERRDRAWWAKGGVASQTLILLELFRLIDWFKSNGIEISIDVFGWFPHWVIIHTVVVCTCRPSASRLPGVGVTAQEHTVQALRFVIWGRFWLATSL